MTSSSVHPIAEFCDPDQYRQPEGHEILRPKPRRPGDNITDDRKFVCRREVTHANFLSRPPKPSDKPPLPAKNHRQVIVTVETHPQPPDIDDVDKQKSPADIRKFKSTNRKSPVEFGPEVVHRSKRLPSRLKLRRKNISKFANYLSMEELPVPVTLTLPMRKDSGSSSDENRSSGHASMSDGHSSSPLADTLAGLHLCPEAAVVSSQNHSKTTRIPVSVIPEDESVALTTPTTKHAKPTNRKLINNRRSSTQLQNASGLAEIRHVIETMSTMSTISTQSDKTSTTGSEVDYNPRRLFRHPSLETITSADEFIWVDSHCRLVELTRLPWTHSDVLKVLQNGRLKHSLSKFSTEVVPRLSYLLQRALVRIAIETQRFSKPLGFCGKQEVASALRVVLLTTMAESCLQSCLRSAAMFTGVHNYRQCKSARAGLQFDVGRFHRWMSDVAIAKFVHEYAAIYLASGIETLLEEIMVQCLPEDDANCPMTASGLEHAIANNGELWGLLQPYSHMNTGRTATGALAMPKFAANGVGSPAPTSTSLVEKHNGIGKNGVEQNYLTTCVGTITELRDLINRVTSSSTNKKSTRRTWTPCALHTLFYFMRCSQLEYRSGGEPVQELVYERPYVVLPPIIEWIRIASAHAEHRHSSHVDKDDIMQAARLLLPGVDCPIRHESFVDIGKSVDASDWKTLFAFWLFASGKSDVISTCLQLLPSTKLNTLSDQGLTPLMMACLRGDENLVRCLVSAGADVNVENPGHCNPQNKRWTALTYATILGHLSIIKYLLDNGANVEGGAQLNEDKVTITPLQIAAAVGDLDIIDVLLSNGAHPFLSTLVSESLSFGFEAQNGCYNSLSVASAHGQRLALHKLLSHPSINQRRDVLSLEEVLAEEANSNDRKSQVYLTGSKKSEDLSLPLKLTKRQIKSLQEAMYHSSENDHLEITLDLRNIGVPWTLHCWMHSLDTANDAQLDGVIDQLLQDFQPSWPMESTAVFVEDTLPLLFDIFRQSKNEGTSLLLADIFSGCFGKDAIKIRQEDNFVGGVRIDPKYVNNPELSDVQFRVEGRICYAHKIILINSSPCFKSMLATESIIHINDIRYDVFQMVMHYLYNGRCDDLELDRNDILELMAAANFFQLDGLLRFCEITSCKFVDRDNAVAMYIHAKIYNAEQLVEYCLGFFLQNLVALLTYDDSVLRLLFGKKQSVLPEMLAMLQKRIRTKTR